MKLKDLINTLHRYCGITANSKEVKNNFIFVAVNGATVDGREFIPEAVKRGAKAVISSGKKGRVPARGVRFITVKDARRALAKLAAEFYGNPSRKIKVVGVTGTNGKTTVTYLIEAILIEAGKTPAVAGTINCRFKDRVIPAINTTPGPTELQSLLYGMQKECVDYALMEVSSHALDQQRTGGIDFHSAIFTNLTQDHLDYHLDLENYFLAKARLFKNLGPGSFAVINSDDECSARLTRMCKAPVVSYGIKRKAQVRARDIDFGLKGSCFLLCAGTQKLTLRSNLIGMHNIYNILAAAAWAIREGIAPSVIESAIKKFQAVPGRLERIECRRGFSVFVDYAHTEDALKNILESLRRLSAKRVIVVFGCGGQRDKTKRPKMGSVVSRMADFAIITNDNPRQEDPSGIIEDIRRGISKKNYCVIPERAEAIKKSLELARRGDIVLVAGKGHEDYQIIRGQKLHFDDREVVRECLSSMN